MELVWGLSGLVAVSAVLLFVLKGRGGDSTKPHPPQALLNAKKKFIAQMNKRIHHEPQITVQLQTQRDMVVGWYELKGPVTGVRFVAKACCKACDKLDSKIISLLDVASLVKHMPPVHRESGRLKDCCCTLQPVSAAPPPASKKGGKASKPSGRSSPRSTPAGKR